MGRLYFVRHGETYWNVENKICGATDIALTPFGHEQAVRTAEEIVRSGIRFDEIISSPLIRARDTAEHISKITGVPMRTDVRGRGRVSESKGTVCGPFRQRRVHAPSCPEDI